MIGLLLVIAGGTLTPEAIRQNDLDAISSSCGAPKAWLRKRGDEVRFHPARSAKYAQVDCVLGGLRHRYPGGLPMGFVGNEAYAKEKPE